MHSKGHYSTHYRCLSGKDKAQEETRRTNRDTTNNLQSENHHHNTCKHQEFHIKSFLQVDVEV